MHAQFCSFNCHFGNFVTKLTMFARSAVYLWSERAPHIRVQLKSVRREHSKTADRIGKLV